MNNQKNDNDQLSDMVADMIIPALRFLLTEPKEDNREAERNLGKFSWKKALEIWNILNKNSTKRGALRSIATSLASDPSDEKLKEDLKKALRLLFDSNNKFASDINSIIPGNDYSIKVLEGPSTHITADRWTLDDKMGFQPYAYAIYRFITNPDTKGPLTISIQAPWGAGKTSMMKIIRLYLDPAAEKKSIIKGLSPMEDNQGEHFKENATINQNIKDKSRLTLEEVEKEIDYLINNPEKPKKLPIANYAFNASIYEEQHIPTVWFNAWKYQSTNQVWAGLADAIINQVAERLPPIDRERFWIRLNIERIDSNKIRNQIYENFLSYILENVFPKLKYFVFAFLAFGATALIGWSNQISLLSNIVWPGTILSAAVAIIFFLSKIPDASKAAKSEPAAFRLSEYMQMPDYRSELGFIHLVVSDLKRVFESLPEQKMVVFVDDLDRCSPQRVSEVMEGINLFLGGDFLDCIFVIGMDAEMVAAALDFAHADVLKNLPNCAKIPIGWRFMDKFVQLPFTIPVPERIEVEHYIDSLLSKNKNAIDPSCELFSGLTDDEIDDLCNNPNWENEIIKKDLPEDEFATFKKLIEFQIIKRRQDSAFRTFNDGNNEICDLIRSVAEDFSHNPRELKRFINTFRLHYFLFCTKLEQAKVRGTNTELDIKQLERWVVLSMKWPEVVRWIQQIGCKSLVNRNEIKCPNRLEQLELMGENSTSIEKWLEKAKEIAQLNLESAPWINDDDLRHFFHREFYEYEKGQRLSNGMGKGLW